MGHRYKFWIAIILAGYLSGAFWLFFFLMAEGFTASDYRPGFEPSEAYVTLKVALAVVAGPTIFSVLLWIWYRFVQALAKE